MVNNFIPDPNFDDFNGVFVGGKQVLPQNEYDLAGIAEYIRSSGKDFSQLSSAEIEKFKFPNDFYKAKEA